MTGMTSSVKHQYALDSKTEQFVNIEKLEEEDRERDFTCLGCGNFVRPVMGEIQQWHFRHKVDINSSCSGETYLHFFAKKKLYEVYNRCLEERSGFYIEYDAHKTCTHYAIDHLISCELPQSKIKFDLTKYFDKIELERKEGSFIPDLLLTSKNHKNKLFIEIAVTHASTKEKIESGNRIIEIFISSEANIFSFDNQILCEGRNIYFYNFLNRKFKGDFCKGERHCSFLPYSSCAIPYIFFIIYNNHESKLERKTFEELDKEIESIHYKRVIHHPQNRFEYLAIETRNKFYLKMVIEHFQKGYKIDNCFLCSKHKPIFQPSEIDHIYCNLFDEKFNSNQAATCSFYQANPIKIGSLIRYVGGMIKYRNKMGRVTKISGTIYTCNFNGKLTAGIKAEELELVKG